MLAAILEQAGMNVIYNFAGSNLSRGLASTLIQNSNLTGSKINGDIAIFEVDEATMPEVTGKLTPRIVAVNNLFRDQLDRCGELDKTANIIGNSIKNLDNTMIILNADDPLVASLKQYNQNVVYYGISDDKISTKSTGAIDSRSCIYCGEELVFSSRYFGHLGVYQCPKCGESRPHPELFLSKAEQNVEGSSATYNTRGLKYVIKINMPGLYNLYNALAAATIATNLFIPAETIAGALAGVSAAFGRMERVQIGNKNILLLLVKNPTGFTQSIETLTYDKKKKNLLIALNDNFADGTDVSWIWDAEFEIIKPVASEIVTTGIRAEDLMVRLKYADFDLKKTALEKDIAKALDLALSKTNDGDTLYVLPTYTAMLELRRYLAKKGLVKGLLE
jgi:UDP-N-acetylmuramyl tripeptide synthase